VIERLLRAVDVPGVDAVACPYRARDGHRLVVRKDGMPVRPGQFTGVQPVDSAGFGCLLVRSEILEGHVFTHGPRGERHWYDWWFPEGGDLKMFADFGMEAEHLTSPTLRSAPLARRCAARPAT